MKPILTILAVMSLNFVSAQCPIVPECLSQNQISGQTLTNLNLQGNQCFYGFGSIAQSVNWNNWNWLQFHSTTASINLQQNVNFGGGTKKTYNTGYVVNYWGNTSFNGGDTLIIGTNCTVQITNPISNNSTSGNYNTIVMMPGSTLFVGLSMVQYYPGQVIQTNSSNNSNNIYIISCSDVPLGNKIMEFGLKGDILNWFVEDSDDIQLQYSEDGINFRTIYYTSQNQGYYKAREAGFYRLKADEVYSKIERYQIRVLEEPKVYYYMGKFYKEKPKTNYYGTK